MIKEVNKVTKQNLGEMKSSLFFPNYKACRSLSNSLKNTEILKLVIVSQIGNKKPGNHGRDQKFIHISRKSNMCIPKKSF